MQPDFLTTLARFVLDHSVLPLLVLDTDGRVLQMNVAAKSAEVDFADLFTARAEDMTAFLAELQSYSRAQIELTDVSGCWQLDGVSIDGVHVVRAREVGGERALHQELQNLRSKASFALLAPVSLHDLADALAPVLLLSTRLAGEAEKGTRTATIANDIQSSATLAANLVRELLPLARPQPRSIECIDVNVTVRENRAFVERVLGRGNTARFETCAEQASVVADHARLQHVLLLLAAIARDEMPDGGEAVFRTRVLEDGDGIWVAVEATPAPRAGADEQSKRPPASIAIDLASLQSFARESGGQVVVTEGRPRVVALKLPRSGAPARRTADGEGVVLVADRDENVRQALVPAPTSRACGRSSRAGA